MKVAIITESFAPDVNGVAHTVQRVAEQLVAKGHLPLVVAPQPSRTLQPRRTSQPSRTPQPSRTLQPRRTSQPSRTPQPRRTPRPAAQETGTQHYPVLRVASIPLPGYPGFRLGMPAAAVRDRIASFGAEVVHLASPVVLGAWGARVATQLGIPSVAVYQTDLPSYARAYRLGTAGSALAWRWLRRVHARAERTLAPSTVIASGLVAHGIRDVWLWGRGVDCERFHPSRRSAAWRSALAPHGEVLAGYVGRLATEKRVDLLTGIARLDGVRLVITGEGPCAGYLRAALPAAVFLGARHGTELAEIYASLDIFVHSGPYETFGQTLQEAAASGLPVVAPAAGGPLDLVHDGVTGFLVTPGDAAALRDAVRVLARNPALRAQFGAAGRRMVEDRSWPALTDELLGHYDAVLRRGHGAVPVPA